MNACHALVLPHITKWRYAWLRFRFYDHDAIRALRLSRAAKTSGEERGKVCAEKCRHSFPVIAGELGNTPCVVK